MSLERAVGGGVGGTLIGAALFTSIASFPGRVVGSFAGRMAGAAVYGVVETGKYLGSKITGKEYQGKKLSDYTVKGEKLGKLALGAVSAGLGWALAWEVGLATSIVTGTLGFAGGLLSEVTPEESSQLPKPSPSETRQTTTPRELFKRLDSKAQEEFFEKLETAGQKHLRELAEQRNLSLA